MWLSQQELANVTLGNTDINKVYLGTNLIRQRITDWTVDFLVVGWWWAWWSNYYDWSAFNSTTWWWGAWWFVECTWVSLPKWSHSVIVGCWGLGTPTNCANWCNGCLSCFDWVIAYWGGWWGWRCKVWSAWASGWWWGSGKSWWWWCQWRSWWTAWAKWWWGWWAWGNWYSWDASDTPWMWWIWKSSSISWESCWYAWWGWWAVGKFEPCRNCWMDYYLWWWNWNNNAADTSCASRCGCPWMPWVVIIRYPSGCWTATWWTMVTCNWYNIHTFTDNGTFSF